MTRINIILFLFLLAFNDAVGQFNDKKIYHRWGVDKPNLKQDTLTLISKAVSKINIYELSARDSSKWDTVLIATWLIKYDNGKIISNVLQNDRAKFNYPFESLNKTTDKLLYTKNKITETIGHDGIKIKFTHFLNPNGQVTKTEKKCIDCKFESRYDSIGIIEYKYKDGLLSEAIYFGDGRRIIKGSLYSKYIFDYIK